jgi:hypothetical protein
LIFYPFSGVPKTPRAELTQLIDICALDKALLVIRKPGSYLLYYRFSQANLSPGWLRISSDLTCNFQNRPVPVQLPAVAKLSVLRSPVRPIHCSATVPWPLQQLVQ